jgi:hypothetical protein
MKIPFRRGRLGFAPGDRVEITGRSGDGLEAAGHARCGQIEGFRGKHLARVHTDGGLIVSVPLVKLEHAD